MCVIRIRIGKNCFDRIRIWAPFFLIWSAFVTVWACKSKEVTWHILRHVTCRSIRHLGRCILCKVCVPNYPSACEYDLLASSTEPSFNTRFTAGLCLKGLKSVSAVRLRAPDGRPETLGHRGSDTGFHLRRAGRVRDWKKPATSAPMIAYWGIFHNATSFVMNKQPHWA